MENEQRLSRQGSENEPEQYEFTDEEIANFIERVDRLDNPLKTLSEREGYVAQVMADKEVKAEQVEKMRFYKRYDKVGREIDPTDTGFLKSREDVFNRLLLRSINDYIDEQQRKKK